MIEKCGGCHARDERGNLQRISWSRATPEGWQDELKRMILVTNLSLTPAEARLIVKYLSANNALAPEEARPVLYVAERRIHDEGSLPAELRAACARCHALAVPLSWRRSPDEWRRFVDSHAAARGFKADEKAVALLANAAPLHSAEWEAAKTHASVPDPSGRWLVTATIAGHGKYFGEMHVDHVDGDEFTTRVSLTSLTDGTKILRTGRSVAYGGYAWRGRSSGDHAAATPDDLSNEAREVLLISSDGLRAEGRWFWGQYQEFGFEVKLQRASSVPALAAVDRTAFRTGTEAGRIRLLGENFPAHLMPGDLNFGPGITVRRIVSSASDEVVADIDVGGNAQSGKRDVAVRQTILPNAIAVYDRVDYIKVIPESAVASFSDDTHRRGFIPFEAIAYQRGADGRLHTADDVELGPMDVSWSLEVFHAPAGSSADYVGTINSAGLLMPAPNNPGNNYDVWATATAKNEKDRNGAPLSGKSYVVVAVPSYTFSGRRYVRDLDRWIDDGPAPEKTK